MLEQLTYAQIGEHLNISPDGARAIVKRNRLPRSHAKDGRTLVAIDFDELRQKSLPVRAPRAQQVTDVVATLKARIEQLEAELATEQQRSAGHRADYERERARAEQLITTQDHMIGEVKNLRSLLQLAQQAARPETTRPWRDVALGRMRWLRTTG